MVERSNKQTRPGASDMTDEVAMVHSALRGQYTHTQYHYVEFLVAHLADCSRNFDGDLQAALVLAVIGQRHLRAALDAAEDGSVSRRASPADPAISASRIADVTGIPRQTVRRKLLGLQRKGWVTQIASGRWHLVQDETGRSAAGMALGTLDARSIERVARLHTALKKVV